MSKTTSSSLFAEQLDDGVLHRKVLALLDVEHGRDRVGRRRTVADLGELDDATPSANSPRRSSALPEREARLAHAAGPDQRDEMFSTQQLVDSFDVDVAPDEPRRVVRSRGARAIATPAHGPAARSVGSSARIRASELPQRG